MSNPVVVVAPEPELAERFVAFVERASEQAIAARGRFAWVICGGSAAEKLLPPLQLARVDWSRTDVLWSDERFVPRGDPASNASTAARLLFDGLGVSGPRAHPMLEAVTDPVAGAERYAETVTAVLGADPTPDLALLGIGEDGHVASLFPGRTPVEDDSVLVLVERHSPKPPPLRLTLSFGLLARSREVVLAAFGAGKAGVVRQVLNEPDGTSPAARLLRRASNATLLLDPAAASRLDR